MKKILFLLIAAAISLSVSAQGNSQGKGKDKDKGKPATTDQSNSGKDNSKGPDKEKEEKEKKEKADHDKKVWAGTSSKSGGPLPSKNQPAKVRAAFQRDYPNAGSVSWSKYRGDWTATFRNGAFWSTAVYHANGERRDTRTPITREEVPGNILDSIFKRRPTTKVEDVIKVEVPEKPRIFRIREIFGNKTQYTYYNSDGLQVTYNY